MLALIMAVIVPMAYSTEIGSSRNDSPSDSDDLSSDTSSRKPSICSYCHDSPSAVDLAEQVERHWSVAVN